jgi:hypothetical protein
MARDRRRGPAARTVPHIDDAARRTIPALDVTPGTLAPTDDGAPAETRRAPDPAGRPDSHRPLSHREPLPVCPARSGGKSLTATSPAASAQELTTVPASQRRPTPAAADGPKPLVGPTGPSFSSAEYPP